VPRSRTPLGLLAQGGGVVLVAVLLTACGKEPVSMPTLQLSAADQAVCQRVTDAVPDSLAGQDRRKTQPAAAFGGAWGDPPIVLQCGVDAPAGLTRTSHCAVVDGVAWFVPDDQLNDDAADADLTAVGYEPRLQLSVPARYRGGGVAEAEVQLAPIIKKYLTPVHRCA
jgi:hypothetical protein